MSDERVGENLLAVTCPVPGEYDRVVLGHGGGGRLTDDLIRNVFLPALGNPVLDALEDQATLAVPGGRIAMTTDGFVVHPRFFPGGDIGKLAVCGTVNDLVVGGATPKWLAVSFILEEGLPLAELAQIARSMRAAADEAGVIVVAGDTKVVDRGKGDGVFVTTTGVGVVPPGLSLSARNPRPGDVVIVSGTLGDHGVAILSAREGLSFETALESDCAPLGSLVRALFESLPPSERPELHAATDRIRCMRDPTRGGLASVLHELAAASGAGFVVDEGALPVRDEVRGACELFGLDPVHVASEGRLVAVVAPEHAEVALRAMRSHPLGRDARVVARVTERDHSAVLMRTTFGEHRVITQLSGELLPRIC